MAARGFLGAGDLYIARFSNGVAGPLEGPFEAGKFEIKPNSDLKEMMSKGKTTYGQVIETAVLPKPFDLTVELREVNKAGLALALFGTVDVLTQAQATVVDEVITAKSDKWVSLANARVSSVVVTNSAGSTTYVNGTDYIVSAEIGAIKVLSTGAIADAASLKVDYTAAAISGSKITGGTDSAIRAKFVLDGVNFADNSPYKVTVYEAVIGASGAFDFLNSDFNSITMPGRMKTPTGYTGPFLIELKS